MYATLDAWHARRSASMALRMLLVAAQREIAMVRVSRERSDVQVESSLPFPAADQQSFAAQVYYLSSLYLPTHQHYRQVVHLKGWRMMAQMEMALAQSVEADTHS
jgi:hypothetical protein